MSPADTDIRRILSRASVAPQSHPQFAVDQIRRETVWVTMRDGARLATELFLPPALPAPVVALRTPYGRCGDTVINNHFAFATRGYAVIAQDCRGTGDSEPDVWDYTIHESEDGSDFVDWVRQQDWFDGFLASCGGSYAAMTQWCMSAHPGMSAIAPEVGGLRTTRTTVRQYMFVNGYSRVIGKGRDRLPVPVSEIELKIEAETMAGGYFNEPLHDPISGPLVNSYPALRTMPIYEAKRWLWSEYCSLSAARRVELLKRLLDVTEFSYADYWSLPTVFNCLVPYGLHTIPSVRSADLCEQFNAPALVITGWYDWNLADVLSSWAALTSEAPAKVASRSRLLVTPAAHHLPGYHEGEGDHPELRHNHRFNVDLLLKWYETVRQGATDSWPTAIYYLMGANEWRFASAWPVPKARQRMLYLHAEGALKHEAPPPFSPPDRYTYDPTQPTPTVGGSVLSFLYPVGSVDVSKVQTRADVLTYTTAPLEHDLDVVGPLRVVLYASSSATDTDFMGRLSDVFPDGRALYLQSGALRARYRKLAGEPELLEPGATYRLEIELGATANRFKRGHRLRLDISSADFPRFDRNANLGGAAGDPIPARQTIYHDTDRPSHLLLSVLESSHGN